MVFDGAYHMGSWSGAVCTPSRHMIMSGRTVWHIPDQPGRSQAIRKSTNPKLVPPDLARAHHAGRLQPRRLRHDADLQERQQLRGGQQTVHRSARRHQTRRHRRDRQRLAREQVLDYLDEREASQGHAIRF